MPYRQLFYHLVWTTKNRQPLLTPEVEPIIHDLLRSKAIGLEGTVFAINGVDDHVHMVVSIPPKIAVATFVGKVKGVASTRIKQKMPLHTEFYWQDEYGAFSFDGKRLPNVIAYVEKQKAHHAQSLLIPILERVQGEVNRPIIKEEPAFYVVDDMVWCQEMLALE